MAGNPLRIPAAKKVADIAMYIREIHIDVDR